MCKDKRISSSVNGHNWINLYIKKGLDKRLNNAQFSVPNVIDPNLEQGFQEHC